MKNKYLVLSLLFTHYFASGVQKKTANICKLEKHIIEAVTDNCEKVSIEELKKTEVLKIGYGNERFIKLRKKSLWVFENLKELDLNPLSIIEIHRNFFKKNSKLKVLRFLKNELYENEEQLLKNQFPKKYEKFKTSLNILLSKVKLNYLRELEKLVLQISNQTQLKKILFSNYPKLKKLMISSNEAFPLDREFREITKNNRHLKEIYFWRTKIILSKDTEEALGQFNKLQVLTLKGNFRSHSYYYRDYQKDLSLSEKDFDESLSPFKGLINLESLNLSNNFLKHVHKNFFKGLFKLKKLILDDNPLNIIERRSFVDQENLLKLNLRNTCLRTLSFFNVQGTNGLQKIKKLEISRGESYAGHCYTHINEILPHDFSGMKNLEYLKLKRNLNYNNDMTVHENAFSGLPKLRKLYLNGIGIKGLKNGWSKGLENNLEFISIESRNYQGGIDLNYVDFERMKKLKKVEVHNIYSYHSAGRWYYGKNDKRLPCKIYKEFETSSNYPSECP